jgi:hypothetical protein
MIMNPEMDPHVAYFPFPLKHKRKFPLKYLIAANPENTH